ncbi:hypothetical protein H4W33_006476 [Kibdelosporangium phytohabitans]|uniref:hypothetical protein n=1 Tax=Kibdelosporangium phytohabitans TaxID=860235 RepID=UPI000AA6E9A7|nr:hypothetical protein [Kibdelosporangium phytohabitans]MBE1467464.1 hypothetical protein [Kibdelosporangium phytohabitans]
MTDVTVPPIPLSLQHLPTVGGLVVPWITPRTADGRYLFGSVDHDRMGRALVDRWCGVCGRPLEHRAKQEELHLIQHSSIETGVVSAGRRATVRRRSHGG